MLIRSRVGQFLRIASLDDFGRCQHLDLQGAFEPRSGLRSVFP
jgi:hypothetical protein